MVTIIENKISKDMNNAIKEQEHYKALCDKLDRIYEGEYEPVTGDVEKQENDNLLVKSNLLYKSVEDYVDMHMPKRGNIIIPLPRSNENIIDYYTSKTADILINYSLDEFGYDELEEAVRNSALLNYGYIRIGFKKDESEFNEYESEVNSDVYLPEANDKLNGQPFYMTIHPKDLIKGVGFKTIKEAMSFGGMVARRFWAKIDWVKSRKSYKNLDKIKADVMFKGQEPESVNKQKTDKELEYCELWEVFYGKNNKYPEGRYFIWSNTQKIVLYEYEGSLFEGIMCPIVELYQFVPRRKQYATPIAARAMNPMFEYEYYETSILNKIDDAKTIIFQTLQNSDNVKTLLKDSRFQNVVVVDNDDINVKDVRSAIEQVEISPDIESAQMGSARALARFEDLVSVSMTKPRISGGQIATEMVIENRKEIVRINKRRENIANFISECCEMWLDIAKQLMSKDEMIRITRDYKKVWHDEDERTLEGNYSIVINSDSILDMSEGERAKALQMALTTINALSVNPQYAKRINAIPVIKDFLESLNVSVAEVFNDGELHGQWQEIVEVLTLYNKGTNPISVSPDDNHIEHIEIINLFNMLIEKFDGIIDERALQYLAEHLQEHTKIIEMQSQGGMKAQTIAGFNQQNNPTNLARNAGASSFQGDNVGNSYIQNG